MDINIPEHFTGENVAVSPRRDFDPNWLAPSVCKVVGDKIRIQNLSGKPIIMPKNKHFADLTKMTIKSKFSYGNHNKCSVNKIYDLHRSDESHLHLPKRPHIDTSISNLKDVKVDPDKQLTDEMGEKFFKLCSEYSDIITPVPGKYNGHFGRVDNSLHFSSTPAPIKARLPNYSYEK